MLFDVGDDFVVIFASHGVTALTVHDFRHISPLSSSGIVE
jgi:hypothetical protein